MMWWKKVPLWSILIELVLRLSRLPAFQFCIMNKKISSALISVFYKDGLEEIISHLKNLGVTIYSTGGTQKFIESLGAKCVPVEDITGYPSILGGRVKTLHPSVFGGILGRRQNETDVKEMKEFKIPELDLVIVDLYPFEETLKEQDAIEASAGKRNESAIIEKIDIGGPSMIRAAAKNFQDLVVVASKNDYAVLAEILANNKGETTIDQRKDFARKAFETVAHYDVAISKYFSKDSSNNFFESIANPQPMRYGENPHQSGKFYGDLKSMFNQLNGKELSYNNLVDVDAAVQLIGEFGDGMNRSSQSEVVFAIIKHTNVCGIASRGSTIESWNAALAGDPESAFGGVLICNSTIDSATASAINNIFFEVLIAPEFNEDALEILKSKKNRILLQMRSTAMPKMQYKSVLNGVLTQTTDVGNYQEWNESGGRETSENEKRNLIFANAICKHLKSNAIALVKDLQLVGKGCGQTSRIDSLRQAVEKAKQFNFDLNGAVMASDAFFPFDDCVKLGHDAGIAAFIQPGGSIRDKDSIEYCRQNNLAMVITGMRHFKH